jgi:Ca2+-binding RTX toxin-like protein
LWGGDGNDVLEGQGGKDKIYGGKGKDRAWGDAGNDTLEGWNGNDKLYGGTGEDTLYGGKGGDALNGGLDNDLIRGNDGADTLDSGQGNDVLSGGNGQDAFVFSTGDGKDKITDFDAQDDTIVFDTKGIKYSSLTFKTASDNDLIIMYGSDQIRLDGIDIEDIQRGWFDFT